MITVFTSNQPRHLAFLNSLARISDNVHAVVECRTNFPGLIADIAPSSSTMAEYFSRVTAAEAEVFGGIGFVGEHVKMLPLRAGDLNYLDRETLAAALEARYFIVFGASIIRGWLAETLIAHKAVNLHMGVSPYYRGNSCNFWAQYDGRVEYVGATIHLINEHVDAGDILFHALPAPAAVDPFVYGMLAARAAQNGIINRIGSGTYDALVPQPRNPELELRYSRARDFTDDVAREFLDRNTGPDTIAVALRNRDLDTFVLPYVDD